MKAKTRLSTCPRSTPRSALCCRRSSPLSQLPSPTARMKLSKCRKIGSHISRSQSRTTDQGGSRSPRKPVIDVNGSDTSHCMPNEAGTDRSCWPRLLRQGASNLGLPDGTTRAQTRRAMRLKTAAAKRELQRSTLCERLEQQRRELGLPPLPAAGLPPLGPPRQRRLRCKTSCPCMPSHHELGSTAYPPA